MLHAALFGLLSFLSNTTVTSEAVDLLPEVALRTSARIPGARVLLADVIAEGDRSRLPQDVLRADLGRAPSAGFTRRIDQRAIVAAVPEGLVRFTGADEVLVQTDVISIDVDRLVDAAREAMLDAAPIDADAEIEVVNLPREVICPRGRDNVEVRARLKGAARARGAMPVQVDVIVDGQAVASAQVTFLVRTYAWLPVLQDDLRKGDLLSPSNLDTRRVETTRLGTLPADDPSPMLGRVARRNIRSGEYLNPSDYELPVLVERNQAITISYRRTGLVVDAYGIAKEGGRLGDIIRVENLRTRKILYGRVSESGRVDINP